MSVLFGPGDTTGLSPAEVTFDGSTSTVAWPSSSSRAGADGADVCMPAGVGMSTLKDTSGYFGKARDRESVRERFAPSVGGSPGSPTLRGAGGHLDAKNQRDPERASPRGQLAASRAQAEQLRDEVAQLHHLLHQTRELHASEASRLHFQLQESKTTARREQGLREEAELREKAKSSQCDQLQKEIGALKQQLTKRHIHIGGSSQGNSPLNSLKGEDLKQLGTELQQIRQDSQELRDLMAKQHDEELQRLREDLEQTQQSSRKAHHAVSKLEAAQKQQSISDQAATRKLEDRCLQLEHYTEIAEAKRMAATEELRAMEAAYQKLDQEMHQEQAAARQAHTQLEQLSLEQKSMILDQALQEEAQERASQLTKRFAASEVQREDLERQLRQERHQLHLVQKQLDATALYHDRAQERICALEASAKSADLQQAVECASFWTEQDALRRSQRQTAISEERARQLQFEVKSLECQQEHTRQLQLQVEKLESKEEAAEQAQLELKDQHSMAESKVSQLQDAVSFLQQRVTQNAGTDAKLSEIQMMFRKVLNRYKKLLASSADTHISTVTCESKLSEMEMLMRGVEEEQDALISLQEQQQLNLASAETREKALQSEAAEEMRESIGLRALLRSAELRSDTQESALQRLMEDVAELGTDRERHMENLGSSKRAVQELQQEIYSLQDRLQSSSSLSEAHLGAHMRAENQAQSLQKKWLDEHLQCQAAEAQLLQCQYRLEQEEQLAKELDAKERRQREFSEEAQDALRKLQIQNQRLELKVASNLRSMGQEEEAMKGMQQALEEAHQELHTLRAEQQSHLADSVGAKVRVRAATESFEAMCQERAELHEELHDTKLRFCNSQLEHAAEKTEGMAARGSLKQLEMKLQAALRSEQQYLQDFQQQTQALQRVEASEKALTAQLLQVEAELDNCEATRANELSVQHSKLQYEEAHVKDLQSALASLQAEHEGLLWQFQVERAQSEDRYQDLTKEVHELRTQEMELKLKVAHTDDLHNLLSKRTEESVYELQKARDELSVCQGHLQAEEEELRRLRTEEAELRSRDTVLVQLQNQETERARRSDWLREESEERLASAFQMTQRLQQSLDSANEALKTSVQSQHSKDELYTNLLKDYRSLQDEEQRRQRAQNEFQQRLLEEGARVKALEALKHREEETIEHVSQVLKEASEEHQANSLKYQAQIQEMKTGQEQLLEQVKQETNEQISHLCETNRSLSAECRELLTASREADEMHQGNVQRMQKNLDEMKGHCASCENVADSMRSRAEGLTAQLRLAQDEVKARSVMLAHTEEQAAFQRQQHLLEMKELEDEYAKQAWQADKNELKIQQMMAESSSTAAETVSRIARSQEKEAKAAARAEQLEIILRELRATLAHSQEESIESSKQVLSLEKAHSDFQEKLAENRKITADLEAQIHDLEDQLKLCSTELHESEARHLQQQQQQISQERTRQQAQEMQMEQMQQQCQMTQVQMSEAHDALQAKEKEIRHLEKLQEEDQKRHSSLSSLRDQLDFNCRELNHQIQQLNAVNKEEQKKSTAIQLRLEQVEAEAQYASSEAVQAARQQEFAFETLMARCSASEHSVQQLEETRKQLRAQLAAQSRLRESERYAEQVVAATTAVPAEPPDSDAVRRNLEAKGLELTELEFTLREVELNSDRLQQYLEQSQSNLEMQTEEKIRLEDHYAEKRRQLMDTEAKLREVQGQCSYWKSQHQSEEQRAQQWETKVEDLLRDLQCLQSELAKVQGLPPAEVVLRRDDSRDSRDEIRQLQQELQLLSGQAKEQAQQLEHGRSVQQNLMAARAQLDEGYREAQERLAQAEEDLDELRAQGNSRRSSEARHYQEELLALRTAQTTMEAQSQTRERSAEERVQKLTMDLRHLSQKNNNLLQENQDRKAAALNLEDSIKRLRTDVDYMSTARREEGEMFMHQEDATRHLEIALEVQTQRTEELCSENSNLHSEIEQLERRCRGQEEKSAQTLQGALSIEKQLLAVRAKHGQLQEAYREQRHLRAKEAEDGRASTKGIVDALKEELSQLREEAAAERAVREETDRIQEEVEEKVRRLHSEELQGIHFEHNALRSALHLQRRNSTAALEAQRWALRREKQLRKKRYALLMAASEELRGGLMRLKEATDSAAEADASVEDQDQQVAEELEQVKLAQQVLSDSRAVEQEKMARLDEVQLQLKDERKAATPNQLRIEELLVAERLALEEVEKQEAVVAEDKQHFNEDYKKLEEAHTEERCSRERAEAYHHQVAAETQLLAVDLLKLQGVFEADGESESNFSQGSKGVREGRPLLEVASSEDEEEGSETGEVNPTTDP